MERISAADNIIIEFDDTRWRTRINTDFVENVQGSGVLMEAADGQPLRYTSAFARTRRLPKDGQLPTAYIQRVVLGWSYDDDAWHLGLLLESQLASVRGSRWCEIVKWPDPEQDLYHDLAVQAGQQLARMLDCPFNLIPIREQPPQKTTAVRSTKPLPALPLELQEWHFRLDNNGWLTFVRDGAWQQERVRRVLWYGFWSVAYVVLSIATITGDIALPRPEFLPYLGLVTAVILIGLVGYNLWELRNRPRRIIVDPTTQQIWGAAAEKARKPLWRMERLDVDSVYASEIVRNHKPKQTDDSAEPVALAADIKYGELNLRLTDGTYYFLLSQQEEETIGTGVDGIMNEIQPLDQNAVTTKLQAATVYVAQALNVPAFYDLRDK
jgi:hypothetical protein